MSEPRFGCLVGREEHGLGHVDTTLTDGFAVDEQSDGASFGESASVVVEIGAHLMFARFHRLLGVNLEPLVGSFLVRRAGFQFSVASRARWVKASSPGASSVTVLPSSSQVLS